MGNSWGNTGEVYNQQSSLDKINTHMKCVEQSPILMDFYWIEWKHSDTQNVS